LEQIKAKLRESQGRVLAGRFIVGIVFLLVAYQFLLAIFIEYSKSFRQPETLELLNPGLIFTVGFVAYLMARSSGVPMSEFGFNLNNWKANLQEALVWTAGFLLVLTCVKWVLVTFVSSLEGQAVFSTAFIKNNSLRYLIGLNLTYAILAPVQEFIVRGIIQGSLQNLLSGPKRVFWAILLSNLMFAALHLHNNISFALLTLLPGFFWGIMYYRQKSLLGVSVSHILIGLIGLLFLSLH
ncbi:MAG: CPBP family intramembrane glutamic endopeptidase, partial [Bacteroidota bacterium]